MDTESKEKLVEAIDVVTNAMNIMGGDEEITDAFVEALADGKLHRTLQQTFFRIMTRVMIEYGIEHKEFNDGRNIASVEFAERLEELNPYFPFV